MSTSSTQKRLLTQPTSKLAKSNILTTLRKDDAWILLPEETRAHLYSLLPPPTGNEKEGAASYDPDIHPLKTHYKPYIEEELRRYQEDLKQGREQKKWRAEAMLAARERLEGKFDEVQRGSREEWWGKQEEGKADDERGEDMEGVDDDVKRKEKVIEDSDGVDDGLDQVDGAGEELVVVSKAEAAAHDESITS